MASSTEECIHGLAVQTCSLCKSPPKLQQAGIPASSGDGKKTPENSVSYFGHPWPEWFEMCDVATDYIVASARIGKLVTYGEVWSVLEDRLGARVGSRYRQLPMLLQYVCDRYSEANDALISALAVDDATQEPSEGFFRLAVARDLLPPEDAPPVGEKWTGMTPRQRAFWRRQLDALGYRTGPPA